jgi:hypothetical protein
MARFSTVLGNPTGLIYFCTRNEDADSIIWLPWYENTASNPLSRFIPTLQHELLHVLGLLHPNDRKAGCDTTVDVDAQFTTVMRDFSGPSRLSREDIRFLNDHFGLRTSNARQQMSGSGSAWSPSAVTPPSQLASTMGRPAATNNLSGTNLYIALRAASENSLYVSRVSPELAWSYLSSVPSANAPYLPALSYSSNRNLVLAYQWHATGAGNSAARLAIRASSNGGSSWTSESRYSQAFSQDGGLSSTYDPASGQWLFVMTGTNPVGRGRRIRFFTLNPGDVAEHLPDDWTTGDVPSISCAPGTEVNYNCLLTWQDDTWRPGVSYSFCRVIRASPTGDIRLDCLPKRHHGYYSVGSAPVSYAGAQFVYPWQIALSQGGQTLYTWRRDSNDDSSWVTQVPISYAPQSVLPALGAQLRAGVNRRSIVTLDE